jgi:hypothetical protein
VLVSETVLLENRLYFCGVRKGDDDDEEEDHNVLVQ